MLVLTLIPSPLPSPAGALVDGLDPITLTPVGVMAYTLSGIAPLDFIVAGACAPAPVSDLIAPLDFDVQGACTYTPPAAASPFNANGERPALPLIVYNPAVLIPSDVSSTVPAAGSFLIDAAYLPDSADGLEPSGALAGNVGTRVGSSSTNVFRQPFTNEVVRVVNTANLGAARDQGYLKWDGSLWQSYVTMPQRAMRNMQLFATLDPDGVYDYWGSLLGGLQYCLTTDALSVIDFMSPDAVPAVYLPLLGNLYGIVVDTSLPEVNQRQQVRGAVAQNQQSGLAAGVVARLAQLGYLGYANEVWINPNATTNWTDPATAPSGVQAAILAAGLTVDPHSGVKGQDYVEVAHGASSPPALTSYVPSSRLSVHLNAPDGTPISSAIAPAAALAIKQTVSFNLGRDTLPACSTIRLFVTDLGGGSYRYF